MNTNDISNKIGELFDITRQPAPQIPGALIALCGTQKPALSTIQSVSNVVKKLKEHGIPTDAMPDGSENKMLVMIIAIIDEVYRALREDANIQVSFAPGSITTISTGANAGGPVVSEGINMNIPKGQAIIQ